MIRKIDAIEQPYIIAVTANAFEEDKLRCLQSGANEVLDVCIDHLVTETTTGDREAHH